MIFHNSIVKISGIVITDNRCDASAMPAGIEVSFPYADGMTIVLSPNGIESEQIKQMKM